MDNRFQTFFVYKKLLKMLENRGYTIGECEKEMDFMEFCVMYDQELITCSSNATDRLVIAVEGPSVDPMLIFFPKEDKVGIKPLKTYCEKMNQIGINRFMIVYAKTITPHAKQLIQESIGASAKYSFEYFSFQQLMNDITDHCYVPKHRKLNVEEKKEFLEKRSLKTENLPKLSIFEPISQYYQFYIGDVIEISRCGDAGPYKEYRVVA